MRNYTQSEWTDTDRPTKKPIYTYKPPAFVCKFHNCFKTPHNNKQAHQNIEKAKQMTRT